MKSHFLNSKAIQKIMYNLWKSINGPLPETLPAQVIARSQVIYLTEAIQNIHSAISRLVESTIQTQIRRTVHLQLNILALPDKTKKLGGFRFDGHIGDYFNNFYHQCLPFELTNAQKSIQGNSCGCRKRKTDDPLVTRGRRKRKNLGGLNEYADGCR